MFFGSLGWVCTAQSLGEPPGFIRGPIWIYLVPAGSILGISSGQWPEMCVHLGAEPRRFFKPLQGSCLWLFKWKPLKIPTMGVSYRGECQCPTKLVCF